MQRTATRSDWASDVLRPLIGRLGLGFVMIWFGVGELWQPSQWTGYIPGFLHILPQVPMILVHGYVLFAVGVLLVLGQWTKQMAGLAGVILLSIIFTLVLNGGGTSLYIRDIGLFSLSVLVFLEPRHALTIDDAFGQAPLTAAKAR
jgi:uncharacterized membrane protein YphA (DoxX/SURF4 family)